MRWVASNVPDRACKIVDVGCGNGNLLVSLARAGYTNLVGIDYCEDAVCLARRHAERSGVGGAISFCQGNVLEGASSIPSACHGASLVLDKGTFDAISLGGLGDGRTGSLAARFKEAVWELFAVEPSHARGTQRRFIITSCNWTHDELCLLFGQGASSDADGDPLDPPRRQALVPVDQIHHPSFTFGGQSGQSVTTVVFEGRDAAA